jgi:hypothetical protein
MSDYVRCEKCKNFEATNVEGWYYTNADKSKAKECSCHKKWRKLQVALIRASSNNLPPVMNPLDRSVEYDPTLHYKGSHKSSIVPKLKFILKNFDKDQKVREASMYLSGPAQTQKSTLIKWLGYQLILKGYNVLYVSLPDIISKYSSNSFDEEIQVRNRGFMDKLIKADVLIVDDFFEAKNLPGLWKNHASFEAFRPVYFVSGKKPNEIKSDALDEGTKSLIDLAITKHGTYIDCLDNVFHIPEIRDSIFEGMVNEENE